uniref:NADH dehydrogenase subunit 2 n=1 Tax=Ophrygonius sp. TaxID=2897803 RepID=UPI001EDF997E|nr:NADH dehydrogenase subunit 2 [Ophrygonius sp.]UFK32136.1 NADH dehydrogenase subunit 2 [Ophrygonius sp.]UIN24731.1 NADH dehydrogenase subunit 2 [Ophrygonius sp.]
MNLNKLFFLLLIMSIMIMISSYSWFTMWIMMEVNLLIMISIISMNSPYSTESAIKYFIVQCSASLIFLMGIILLMNNFMMFNYMIFMSLMLKMSAAPFHFWFPEIIETLKWPPSIMLMTIQKISPLIITTYLPMSMNSIIIFSLISILMGSMQGILQTSFKKILTFSSITHTGWMIITINLSMNIWTIYFIFYSLSLMSIVLIMIYYNISNLMNITSIPSLMFITFVKMMITMSGIPPFIMFLVKWLTIQLLIFSSFNIQALIILIITLITIYMYLQTIFSLLLMSPIKKHLIIKKMPILLIIPSIMSMFLIMVLFFPFFM